MPIEVGAICDGKITKITAFGAFAALDDGKMGLIHISEISQGFVKDIHEYLSEGDTVRVKVVKIDENGRISLSIKQVDPPDPTASNTRPERRYAASAASRANQPPAEFVAATQQKGSFEDMMSQFKAVSDDKMHALRQSVASKRGTPTKTRRRYDD